MCVVEKSIGMAKGEDLVDEFLHASVTAQEQRAAEEEARRRRELAQAEALAKEQRLRAEEQARAAEALRVERDRAQAERDHAEHQARVATSRQLAAQAQVALERTPQRALLLAVEALRVTSDAGESRVPAAEQALRQALADVGGHALRGYGGSIVALAFDPDGRWLATGSRDGTARLWDLTAPEPGAESRVLRGHERVIWTLAFDPGCRWLATGSGDGTARLWDLTAPEPGAEPRVLRGHEKSINALAFDPGGRWLATGSDDRTARLWSLRLDELVDLACRTTGRNLTGAEWAQYFPGQPYRKTFEQWPLEGESR